jgi:hypothetical protein
VRSPFFFQHALNIVLLCNAGAVWKDNLARAPFFGHLRGKNDALKEELKEASGGKSLLR